MPMTDTELDLLCTERQSNADLRDAAQDEIDRLSAAIGAEVGTRGVDRVELPDHIALIVVAERKILDKQKLVESGVPVEVIEACTTVSPVQTLRVTRRNPPPKAPKAAKAKTAKGQG